MMPRRVALGALPPVLSARRGARLGGHRTLGCVLPRVDRSVLVPGTWPRAGAGIPSGVRARLPADGHSAAHRDRPGFRRGDRRHGGDARRHHGRRVPRPLVAGRKRHHRRARDRRRVRGAPFRSHRRAPPARRVPPHADRSPLRGRRRGVGRLGRLAASGGSRTPSRDAGLLSLPRPGRGRPGAAAHGRQHAAAPSRGRPTRGAAGSLAAGLTVVATLVAEAFGGEAAAAVVRGLVVAATLARGAGLLSPLAQPGTNRRVARLAAWLVPVGPIVAGLLPEYRVPALHLTFVGGFALLALSVATHVTASHCGGLAALRDGSAPSVRFVAAAVLLVASGRFVADATATYFEHLALAAVLWIAATAFWVARLLPAWLGRR